MAEGDKKLISIVIPCYNEEKNINRTLDELLGLINGHKYGFEVIAVNDGSKDNTWGVIKDYATRYQAIKGVNLNKNFGQSAAYQVGFNEAKGDYVITVSADLETPLYFINSVIDKLDDGYDLVNTHRMNRWNDEKANRQMKSGVANKIISKISGHFFKDSGSGMKGFRRYLLDNLSLYGEMHRFLPHYLASYANKVIEIDVEFKDRDYGVSYYKGHTRTLKVLLDLLTLTFLLYFAKKPFLMMPGRIFGFAGAIVTGLGGVAGFYLLVLKIMGQSIGNRPLLIASVLMIIVGLQSMMLGMLGELLLRIYFESSNKKPYLIREVVA